MFIQYTLHGERIKFNPKDSRIKFIELSDNYCIYEVNEMIVLRKYDKKLGPLATGEVTYEFSFRDKYVMYNAEAHSYDYIEEGTYNGVIYKNLSNEFELNVYCFKCCDNKYSVEKFLEMCRNINRFQEN